MKAKTQAHITDRELARLKDLLLLLLDESYAGDRVKIGGNDRSKITDIVHKINRVL